MHKIKKDLNEYQNIKIYIFSLIFTKAYFTLPKKSQVIFANHNPYAYAEITKGIDCHANLVSLQ